MKNEVLRALAGAACAFLLAGFALAEPVVWTLNGVTFNDGGTASGSFTYDAGTNTFSSINITTTMGSIRGGATYTFVCTAPCDGVTPSSNLSLMLTLSSAVDLTGSPGFALGFSSGLSDAGGSVALSSGIEAACSNATCTSSSGATRTISAGSVFAFAPPLAGVPTLSATGLAATILLLALAAGFTLRKSIAAATDARRR